METVVIYHRADFDGVFCREIAKRHFGDKAEYIGWDYGDPLPVIAPEVRSIYMLDISVDGMMDDPRLTWIDHHKSAIEKYERHPSIPGIRIDGVAACRLAYQWFQDVIAARALTKQDYVDRRISEPMAVRLAGEYDIWDRRDPNAELFQHGLRSRDLANDWCLLIAPDPKPTIAEMEKMADIGYFEIQPDGSVIPSVVHGLLVAGRGIQFAKTHENESIIKAAGFTIQFEGLAFLACNHARYNSHLFTAGITPEHDGCFGFNFDGKQWRVSLYGVPGKPDVDLSKIAVKYGGGGHKQACGFRADKLPFLP